VARGLALCGDRAAAELPWLKPALLEAGLDVEVANDAEALLDRVAHHPPDLVLVGAVMPGLSGLEICARLTGEPHTAHLPVFLVAAHADETLHRQALEAGALGLLTPPESRRLLAAELRSALRVKHVFDSWRRHADDLRQMAAARDALVRVSLADLEVMLGAARRAADMLAAAAARDPWPAEDRRVLRAAEEELAAADETLRALAAVRALDAGEWRFEPGPVDVAAVLEAAAALFAGRDVALTVSVEPDLELRADAALLEHALAALVQHTLSRAESLDEVHLHAQRRESAGVRFEVQVRGELIHPYEPKPITQALQLSLARMVAEAHGGSLAFGHSRGVCLVMDLPPEPTAGSWPPSAVFSRAARAGDGPRPSAATAAADWLTSRTILPAPPRPPRLLPPARG
jgi:CheY-like chemotaxis protein